ncbi:TetR/AcrR family transcriptional regulator [Mycobacterium sp. 1274756.6]|uniref:TetR/AcrR family transcriptional regulator n=1 Tax=Mycobacterium sp. 1274756.6 TaxID=1834076 RepID=UPI0008010290|nr:TetR/AcrR family transcriptional regulator [Mycobacterium sp. 1274756.6]OBJ68250.1 TetR family transcriptional regulator [Mycobacterium sp. 1274756.6]
MAGARERTVPRRRGRPVGGGNTAGQARELLLDAAERCFARYGYRASTMAAIAAEAGYSRAVIYRHFATRDALLDALVLRVAGRAMARIADRLAGVTDPGELAVESLVLVATEVGQDRVLGILSDRADAGSVADLIIGSAGLDALLVAQVGAAFEAAPAGYLRPGLTAADAARFVLSVALGLLLRLVPGVDDADQMRRYARVFVLPALLAEPPPAEPVFAPPR